MKKKCDGGYEFDVASASECTGLIPSLPQCNEEREAYGEIYAIPECDVEKKI